MIRIFVVLAAFISIPSFAEGGDCLDQFIRGQMNREQYDRCVQQRTQTTAQTASGANGLGANVCQAYDACGRSCTHPHFGRPCSSGGGANQGRLTSPQIVQLMWLYYLGFLSKDQLATYLFWSDPWQYYLLTYIYGDRAVDVFLSQYQMQFYNQLFSGGGNGKLNPWLFAGFMNQLQPQR
jgi:hypothetical protein